MKTILVIILSFLVGSSFAEGEWSTDRLDALLLRVFPGYAASSNRLRVATLALASDPSEEWTSGYFANISNQLLNATQPLSTVDGL